MATSDASPVSTRTPTAASAASVRETLVDALGVDDENDERLRNGDAPYARRLLRSLEDNKSYVYALGAIMTVMSVVLPTAGLYEFFRRVDNLEPIELIGVIAAACAVAAIHMTIAAYVYVDWRKKRLCYRALANLPSDDTTTVDDA